VKILLADDDTARAEALTKALGADEAITVIRVPSQALLGDAVLLHAPDVILVDMTRPDRDALDGVRVLAHPVVLFVDEDDTSFMEDAIAAGVSSYNVGAIAPERVKPVLRAAVALFRRHQATRTALTAAELRLHQRTVVDRAKTQLMRCRRFSEPEAHRWLQRQAMASGKRLHEVAESLIEKAAEP